MTETHYYVDPNASPFTGLTVGQAHLSFKNQPEGCKFDIMNTGGVMLLLYSNPSELEIKNISKGIVKLGFIEIDNIIFMVSKFGNCDWQDSPYHIDLSQLLTKLVMHIGNEDGLPLYITLADTRTGIVKVLRTVNMPVEMLECLKIAIIDQRTNSEWLRVRDHPDTVVFRIAFDRYDARINNIYSRYSVNKLVSMAKIYDCTDVSVNVDEVKQEPQNTFWIKKAQLTRYVNLFKTYPTELPEELKPYYCYTVDGGHSLIALLTQFANKKKKDGYLVPACVKTVLRNGYEIKDGYLICDIPYNKDTGLEEPEEDFEY